MKIAVMGAAGRMGRELVRAIAAQPGCSVSGATETAGSSVLGKDIGELAGLERLGIRGNERRRFRYCSSRRHR